jgi:hypothetical protein
MKSQKPNSFVIDSTLLDSIPPILHEGETLSSFIEESIRSRVEDRKLRREFLEHGLASRDDARRSGKYFNKTEVLSRLDDVLSDAKTKNDESH